LQCVDITFADPKDVPEVNKSNCFNSSETHDRIGFNLVFTSTKASAAYHSVVLNSYASILAPLLLATAAGLWL
jgi:hypothetical protein